MPAEALDRYRKFVAAARKFIEHEEAAGILPDRVASVIESALTSPRPHARDLVGRDAKAVGLLTRLPDRPARPAASEDGWLALLSRMGRPRRGGWRQGWIWRSARSRAGR